MRHLEKKKTHDTGNDHLVQQGEGDEQGIRARGSLDAQFVCDRPTWGPPASRQAQPEAVPAFLDNTYTLFPAQNSLRQCTTRWAPTCLVQLHEGKPRIMSNGVRPSQHSLRSSISMVCTWASRAPPCHPCPPRVLGCYILSTIYVFFRIRSYVFILHRFFKISNSSSEMRSQLCLAE